MIRDLFTLTGRWNRLNRWRYFLYLLFSIVVYLILAVVLNGLTANNSGELGEASTTTTANVWPALLVFWWVQICLNAKRLHDLGVSAWWTALPIGFSLITSFITPLETSVGVVVLILNFFIVLFSLWLLFWPGEIGENQYGPDPLDA